MYSLNAEAKSQLQCDPNRQGLSRQRVKPPVCQANMYTSDTAALPATTGFRQQGAATACIFGLCLIATAAVSVLLYDHEPLTWQQGGSNLLRC